MRGYLLKRSVFAVVTIFVAAQPQLRPLSGAPRRRSHQDLAHSQRLTGPAQALEAEFGLDKPVWQQYLLYIGQLFQGNFGVSYANRQPVLGNLIRTSPTPSRWSQRAPSWPS